VWMGIRRGVLTGEATSPEHVFGDSLGIAHFGSFV
jgi:hypothetical protein